MKLQNQEGGGHISLGPAPKGPGGPPRVSFRRIKQGGY